MNKGKIILATVVGIELVGAAVIAIWAYGEAKFYEGRISKSNEIRPVIIQMPFKK